MADTADLNSGFSSNFNQLLDAVKKQGGNPQVTSGYRTTQQQAALYNSGNGGVPVARPGSSLHEKGLAADVTGDSKTVQLLHSLAPQYGLEFPFANDPVHVQLKGAEGSGGTAATSNGQATDSGGPMPLVARLGIVMSMLGATPTTATETPQSTVGQVDTGQTQLATQATPAGQTSPVASGQTPLSDATGVNATPSKDNAGNQQTGQQLAAKYGWDKGSQWEALNNVIMSESGWSDAANPNSTARGIGQNIHGYGPGYEQGNIPQQIDWTLNYIKNRYGSPEAAWQHKLATQGDQGNAGGWY